MKRRFTYLIICGMVAGILSGCGGEMDTASVREEQSVSGAAVSGQPVEMKKEISHRYATDTNLYFLGDDFVLQTRLDGTNRKEIKVKYITGLLGINGGYLYYVTEKNGDEEYMLDSYEIYRIPIEKDGDGWDILKGDRAELVVSDEGGAIDDVCGMNSRYIIYERMESEQLVRYDIWTEEKTLLNMDDLRREGAWSYGVSESDLLACTWGGLFIYNMDRDVWEKVSDSSETYQSETVAYNENAFFYTTPNDGDGKQSTEVRKCDLNNFNDEMFVGKKQLRQKVTEAEGIKKNEIDVCGVSDLFLEGDRLYIQVQLNWRRKDQYHVRLLMFSQGAEETELRYEKELTECMKTYGTPRKGEWGYEHATDQKDESKWKVWEENMEVNDGRCYGIVNGKAFVWIHDAKKKYGRVGCYELATGEFRWLSKKDAEYYELCYDEPYDTSGYYEYDPDAPPYFPFYGGYIAGWGPKNERGGFHEK